MVCVNPVVSPGKRYMAVILPLSIPGERYCKGRDKEEIIMAELDFGIVERIRNSINVYRDRRPELYNIK